MKPPEAELRALVGEWVRKAAQDLAGAERLAAEGGGLRELVVFHAQQAAEKYLKALLLRWRIEFPRTHDLDTLLYLLRSVRPDLAGGLSDVVWLTPFGVEIRYPSDFPQTLPGDEARALELAQRVRTAAIAVLGPYLDAV